MSGEMRCGIRNGLTPTVCYRYETQAQVSCLQKRRCCAPCDGGGEGAERIRRGEAPSPPPPAESTRWAQMVERTSENGTRLVFVFAEPPGGLLQQRKPTQKFCKYKNKPSSVFGCLSRLPTTRLLLTTFSSVSFLRSVSVLYTDL